MGRDKALLELAGRPLIAHAVTKLGRVCREVHILGNRPELDGYAATVADLRERCGPLGGIEAAVKHSRYDWNLFMPVDMPFLPAAFLRDWGGRVLAREESGARIAIFTVEGYPQPALCLLHREVAPYVCRSAEEGRYKLFPMLEEAGRELAGRLGVREDAVFLNQMWEEYDVFSIPRGAGDPCALRDAQLAARELWFANLNDPEEFAKAESDVGILDG